MSCAKLRSLYIHYHNTCDYQTSEGGYIQQEASFLKLTQLFDGVVLQDHVKY